MARRGRTRRNGRALVLAALSLALRVSAVPAQDPSGVVAVQDSVLVRFSDVDLRIVIQALGRYLDRPVLVGPLQPVRVTFESPNPVPRSGVVSLLRGLVEAYDLEFTVDSTFYRVSQKPQQAPGARTPSRPAGSETARELFVIRLRHARATDVAGTVAALFGIAIGGGGSRGLSNGTLSDELRRNAAATTEGEMPVEAESGERAAVLSSAVIIVPDELTNSLLVRADSTDFAVIEAAVQHLDLRPLQVLIQVLIVEARTDRFFSLGADATLSDISIDGGDGTIGGSLLGAGLGNLVIQIMKLGSFDLNAVIRTAVTRGDARIVSRPVLLASNNREARILVGSQRPFVQVSRSLPTDTPTRDQVVQYKDVGTKLTVLPTINPDGYVSLLIRQEVNSATTETQFDAPIISTREAETEVLVRDGQTIVLGGLRERQREVSKGGIPVLSEIPILGGLFGFEEWRTIETELFFFITPMILADDQAVDAATDDVLEQSRRARGPLREDRR